MAGLALALLRGREEDVELALPASVVHQIVSLIDTYSTWGLATVLPYVQGLAELTVSDANKQHLTTTPGVIDSLRFCLSVGSVGSVGSAAEDPNAIKLRGCACSALSQLAASGLTLPLLLGHSVLQDLEQVLTLSGVSEETTNDANAVLYAVRLQQEKETAALNGVASPDFNVAGGCQKHVMLSYSWVFQQTFVRVNESLLKRGYATWFDLTHSKSPRNCRCVVSPRSCLKNGLCGCSERIDDGRNERCDR